ncbi:FemAB [Croceicoccus estronivorus]|uniref:FemAB family XrtA/PEP-CTERM system-associated protein n=1 Tax=Croceicoccus estronivorus TaxID=1172626 RepID=UPI000834528E|nr:FemAB family XrtA/PEP-CTERM system-associated protein [Croceicoccus estronivorus]OCC23158.1 FemAB [Croceicoccus estronivorus]
MNAPFAHSVETVRLATLDDPAECRQLEDFVAAHPEGTIFHRPVWLAAIEQGTGQRAVGLIVERGDCISGWLPLTELHSPIFGRALVSSGFAVGGGILAHSKATALQLAAAAEELAVRYTCGSIELRGGILPWNWSIRRDSHCGFVSDLAVEDEAQLLAIPRKQRAEVRKGLNSDLTVHIGTDTNDQAAHYAVYAESVRNLGTPVFPRTLFEAVLEHLDADILTIRHAGVAVASVLSLYHRGTVLPYWGGGTHAARALRANDRMYFELMRHARQRGCTRFDFGRSKTGSGAYHFKRNWGFTPDPLAYASWTVPGARCRDVDPTSPRHAARIAAWKRLPLPLANLIGPYLARGLG